MQKIVVNVPVYTHLKDQKELYKLQYNIVEATSNSTSVSETLAVERKALTFSMSTGKKNPHKKSGHKENPHKVH